MVFIYVEMEIYEAPRVGGGGAVCLGRRTIIAAIMETGYGMLGGGSPLSRFPLCARNGLGPGPLRSDPLRAAANASHPKPPSQAVLFGYEPVPGWVTPSSDRTWVGQAPWCPVRQVRSEPRRMQSRGERALAGPAGVGRWRGQAGAPKPGLSC